MKDTKGITMIALVVIITVLLLLTGTAIYSGTQTLQDAKRTAFVTELKMIKEKVNSYSQAPQGVGSPLSASQVATMQPILASENIGITSFDNFLYFNQANLENLGLAGVKQKEVLINFTTKMVISVEGISIKGKSYYTLGQLGEDNYQVDYDKDKLKTGVNFDVAVTKNGTNWKMEITKIYYPTNVNRSTIRYRYKGEELWRTLYEPVFITNQDGFYEIEVTDSAGNVKIKQVPTIPKPDDLDYKEGEEDTGIVVEDKKGNEFVWVPVPNVTAENEIDLASQIALEKYPMAVKTEGIDSNGRQNYRGVLYNFSLDTTVTPNKVKVTPIANTSEGNREPAYLKDTLYSDNSSYNLDKDSNKIITETGIQESFNQMVEKINNNTGFYVGRYETSYDDTNHVIQVKSGQTPLTAENNKDIPILDTTQGHRWYGLYLKAKGLPIDFLKSYMIWGCQWDQIMIWMKHIPNTVSTAAESRGPFYIVDCTNMDNMVNHISDLGTGISTWTMEAHFSYERVLRGIKTRNNPSGRNAYNPSAPDASYGLRIVLY